MNAGPLRRIAYSLVGLLAGNAALLLVLAAANVAGKLSLLHDFFGKPGVPVYLSFGIFCLYAVFSFAGWLLLGILFALLATGRVVRRWPWLPLLLGAVTGPLSLQLIFVWMNGWKIDPATLLISRTFSLFALLVSTTASGVYCWLLARDGRARFA